MSFLFLVTQETWIDLCVYSMCYSEIPNIIKSCLSKTKKTCLPVYDKTEKLLLFFSGSTCGTQCRRWDQIHWIDGDQWPFDGKFLTRYVMTRQLWQIVQYKNIIHIYNCYLYYMNSILNHEVYTFLCYLPACCRTIFTWTTQQIS